MNVRDVQNGTGPQGRLARSGTWVAARGFTLVELLLVVAVVSILAAGGYAVATGMQESSRITKLDSDVAAINSALQVHLANGGQVADGLTEQAILDEMKRSTAAPDQAATVGFRATRGLVDPRLAADTTDPGAGRPRAVWDADAVRFVVTSSGAGVKRFFFDDDLADVNYGSADRGPTLAADGTTWIWDFAEGPGATPPPGPQGPVTGVGPGPTDPNAPDRTPLQPPEFSPAGGEFAIFSFPMPVTVTDHPSNPSASSQVYVRVNGGAWGAFFGGSIVVQSGDQISAYASAEKDPSNFQNSATVVATYVGVPFQLAVSVTMPFESASYFELGGPVEGGGGAAPATPEAVIEVTNAEAVPEEFRTAGNFQIFYTTDGTDPLTSPTAVAGGVLSATAPTGFANWVDGQLAIRATARAINTNYFESAPVAEGTAVAERVTLSPPYIDPPSTSISADLPVRIYPQLGAVYPTGARAYYTLDGTYPGVGENGEPTSGTFYTPGSAFTTGTTDGNAIVRARYYAPANYLDWFEPSSVRTSLYTSGVGGTGAVVADATINGTYIGSLIVTSTKNFNFNSGAIIRAGNLYVRGTPTVILQGGVIQGRQFLSDGTEIVPATDTRTVVDLNGPVTPSNYFIRLNNGSTIEGKIYRRVNIFSPPLVAAPPGPSNGNSANINSPQATPINPLVTANVNLNNGAGDIALMPGNYGNMNAGSNGAFVLGTPGATTPTVYNFQNMNLNSGSQLKVVGPVILTIRNGFNLNSAVLGNADHPEWLNLRIHSGGVNINSSGAGYADLNAPSSNVQLNGIFTGSVVANSLTINGNGVAITQATVTGDGEEVVP